MSMPAHNYPGSDRPQPREEWRPADPAEYDPPRRDEPGPDPEPSDAERMQAEVQAEQDWPDGTVGVVLYTEQGEALIHVPPRQKWRASAVHAINTDDSLGWAMSALTSDEAMTWQELDPTSEESANFFRAWGRIIGQSLGESRASRRSSTRTRGH